VSPTPRSCTLFPASGWDHGGFRAVARLPEFAGVWGVSPSSWRRFGDERSELRGGLGECERASLTAVTNGHRSRARRSDAAGRRAVGGDGTCAPRWSSTPRNPPRGYRCPVPKEPDALGQLAIGERVQGRDESAGARARQRAAHERSLGLPDDRGWGCRIVCRRSPVGRSSRSGFKAEKRPGGGSMDKNRNAVGVRRRWLICCLPSRAVPTDTEGRVAACAKS
jgi:hypothetical protein